MKQKNFFGIVYSIWIIFLFLVPLFILFLFSFLKFQNYNIVYSLTLENYIYLFSSKIFFKGIFNSLLIALSVSVIASFLAYFFSFYLVFFINKKYHNFFLIAIALPLLTNLVLRSFSLRLILSENGLINRWIKSIGLNSIDFLFNKYIVIFAIICYVLPFCIFITYRSLSDVNKNLLKAGKNLGASNFVLFKKLTFPLSKKSLSISLIFAFIIAMGDFVTPTILGGNSVYTLSIQIIDVLRINNIPRASALGFLIIVVSLPFIYLFLKIFEGNKND